MMIHLAIYTQSTTTATDRETVRY